MNNTTPKGRLQFEELQPLNERIEKLEAFMASENFSKIPSIQQEAQKIQLPIMKAYSKILEYRLENWE